MENVLHMLTHSHNIGPFYNSIRGSPAGRNVEDTKIGRLSVIHKQHANIHLPCSPDKSRENLTASLALLSCVQFQSQSHDPDLPLCRSVAFLSSDSCISSQPHQRKTPSDHAGEPLWTSDYTVYHIGKVAPSNGKSSHLHLRIMEHGGVPLSS